MPKKAKFTRLGKRISGSRLIWIFEKMADLLCRRVEVISVSPIYDKRKNIFCVIKDAYVGIVANMLILIYQRKVVGQLFNKLDEMIVLNIFSLHGSWSIGGEKSVGGLHYNFANEYPSYIAV